MKTAALAGMAVCAAAGMAWAAAVERFDPYEANALFTVENGRVEKGTDGGATVFRWRLEAGRTSRLIVRRDHPLFERLRAMDRLDFEFRIATGTVHGINLEMRGLVTGPRRYKAHDWGLCVLTTPPGVWHARGADFARPAWLPWDKPDGDPDGEYCRFTALALAPDTVIELRNLRAAQALLQRKPDYEVPLTWPVRQPDAPDGAAAWTIPFELLNASGQPDEIRAEVRSAHRRFAVAWDEDRSAAAVKAGGRTTFVLRAAMPAADRAAVGELYAEPLEVRFFLAGRPEAESVWRGELVRPLSAGLRRQVLLGEADLAAVRAAWGDAELARALDWNGIRRKADAFLAKELRLLPTGHPWPGSGHPEEWLLGDTMPEITNRVTGERQFGTPLAGLIWKKWFHYPGLIMENLALACVLSGESAYGDKALELFDLFAEQYVHFPWSRHNEAPWNAGVPMLGASRFGDTSSYAGNIMLKALLRVLSATADHPGWTEERKRRLYMGFGLPYAHEIMKFPGGISNMTDIGNHNVLLLGLFFEDAGLVRWALERDAGLFGRLRDLDAEGFSSEGRPINYHYAGMTEYLPSLGYLERAGLKADYPRERLLAAVRMPYLRAGLNGRIPNAGDCGRWQAAGPTAQADLLAGLFPAEDWLKAAGVGRSLEGRLSRWRAGASGGPGNWKTLLESQPRLFREAGLAILRAGETPDTQVMATLDYGRSLFHGHLDRMQITLMAHGRVFSHGPGSIYNVGSGGMERGEPAQLAKFIGGRSLAQNVILVDGLDQSPAVGRLLAWSEGPAVQAAVAQVAGTAPGVVHTRALALARQVVVVLDLVEADRPRTFDWVYHNFGVLAPGPGWRFAPAAQPLGDGANYENIVNLQRLAGDGLVRAGWDLTAETPGRQPGAAAFLDFWQGVGEPGEVFTGVTGLNNPNTLTVHDGAPSVFHRVTGARAFFWTVLAPHGGESPVAGAQSDGADGVEVVFKDGTRVKLGLDALIRAHGVDR